MAVAGQIVIDSSAALAFLKNEIGGDLAPPYLAVGIMSAVNYAEVVQRFWRDNIDPQPLLDRLSEIGLVVVATEQHIARAAGELERTTKSRGISLADRICLAEAMQRNLPVLTTDRPWTSLGLSIDVKRLR